MAAVTTAVLVDTHFILWLRVTPQTLTPGERNVLDRAPVRHISTVSLWEIAILLGRGRIPGDDGLLEIPEGFDLLPIRTDHCRAVSRLPWHHRDPFDRMLVAQAQSEQVPLLTRDAALTAYQDQAMILRYPDA